MIPLASAWIRLFPNKNRTSPKADIIAACKIILTVLEKEGFTFNPNIICFTKTVQDIRISVNFQLNKYNVSGRASVATPSFDLCSGEFAIWRQSRIWSDPKGRPAAEILSEHVGNVSHWPRWIEWDFCSELLRKRRALAAAKVLRRRMKVLTDAIENETNSIEELLDYELFDPGGIIEYIQFKQGDDQAVTVARRYVSKGFVKKLYAERHAQFLHETPPIYDVYFIDSLVRWSLKNDFQL